jgi:hypothetical protein
MMKKELMPKQIPPAHATERKEQVEPAPQEATSRPSGMAGLQRSVGNQAVQRLVAQRSGGGGTALDAETAERIDRARGGGEALDGTVQAQMSESMGHDLSGVRVHTSPEADTLNRQLSARAFTTGQDVFFRSGEYDPHSSSGQELIAHELTHVVQQGTGAVHGGTGMTVNEPGDAHEQQADAVASQVTSGGAGVQRAEADAEEELVMAKPIQRQEEMPEDELQAQAEEEEEEEEEAIQTQPAEEEEMLQTKLVQRQEELPEEEL